VTPKRYMLTAGIIISVQMGLLAGVYASAGTQASAAIDSSGAMQPKASKDIRLALAFTSQPHVNPDSAPISKERLNPTQKPVQTVQKPAPVLTAAVLKPKNAPKAVPKAEPKVESAPAPSLQAEMSNDPTHQSASTAPQNPINNQTLEQPLNIAGQQALLKPQVLLKAKFLAPPTKPNYPRLARKRGLQGTALVEVLFDNLGKQLELNLVDSSGAAILDKAALDAVKLWQFSPPSPQNALAYRVQVPVTFALN
jgi:periplasmic protein TonB